MFGALRQGRARCRGLLCVANLVGRGPCSSSTRVLFGRVIQLLAGSDTMPRDGAVEPGHCSCSASGLRSAPPASSPTWRSRCTASGWRTATGSSVMSRFYYACPEPAAVVSRRHPFRPADQDDDRGLGRHVRDLAEFLPRPVRDPALRRRAAAADAAAELAAGARADRAGRRSSRDHGARGAADRGRAAPGGDVSTRASPAPRRTRWPTSWWCSRSPACAPRRGCSATSSSR